MCINTAKVAPQADLCYNKALKMFVTAMLETSRDWPHLYRRCDLDTLPPHAQDGNTTTFIYALVDPETKQIRYIGKSNNPTVRLYRHLKEKQHTYKNMWIKSLRDRGFVPEVQIIEEVSIERWQERERYWIAFYRAQGLDLANGTDGGDGVHGRKRTPEERARISEALKGNQYSKGRKHPPEEIARRAAAMKGHSVRPDTGEKIAATKRGKPRSEATKAKLSAALTGKTLPEERVAKMRERKQSPESNAKRSASLKKALSTPEAREVKSQAAKQWWAKQREVKDGA